ncbi:DUF6056 family protein [Helicobacter sp. MIT 14-3879]|uniref:DUF6056 family protein n=1 Tax=Helicobacter sp. MIT 14-3879 TaxID=2040649 RepID=UPI000E1E4CF4|nr:DUF6056 family protein [Helicobacter sp. MIT 14-3879]RDU64646.1 hypothetical protein CQA44_02735 [Helicobacter sp. MIT 14-3879]
MRILNFSVFGVVFLFLLLINILLPRQSDDFDAFFNSQKGFESAKRFYLTWNARIGELFYQGFIGGINPYLFDFLNALVGVMFIFSFFILVFARVPKSSKDVSMLFLTLLILMFFSAFGSDFVWGAGSLNYMWGLFVIIIFLLPFRFYFARLFMGGGRILI